MMKSLAAHQQGGRGNPNYTGLKRPLSHAVFLCLTKFETVSVRLHSVMAGCIGLPSGRPFQCSVFPHPIQPAANVVENKSSGLHPKNTGVTAMNPQATGENCPQSPAVNPSSRLDDLQNLTQLNQAFLKLCCSIGLLNEKSPETITTSNFDMVASDAHEVSNLANALFSQQLASERAIKSESTEGGAA